jgi:hypothetical protein
MSLEYYAFQEHKNLLAMGLHSLDMTEWLLPDRNITSQVKLKQSLWAELGERVYSQLPESHEAQKEVALALGEHLPKHYPTLFTRHPNGLTCDHNDTTHTWDTPETTLLKASWCVQEDLCLLQPKNDNYALTAASLCAPSYWRLLEKIGQSLDRIHAPVPGYTEQLSKKLNRFFQHIKVDRPVWRGNWSVVTSDRLYQPGNEESETITEPHVIPQRCFIRTEHQTLRRMPKTGAVLFTIRVQIKPFTDFLDNTVWLQDLHSALAQLSGDERNYKSLQPIEPALSQWLDTQLLQSNRDQQNL